MWRKLSKIIFQNIWHIQFNCTSTPQDQQEDTSVRKHLVYPTITRRLHVHLNNFKMFSPSNRKQDNGKLKKAIKKK